MIEEGTRIKQYVLLKYLGAGGYGEVWLAENQTDIDAFFVAVKIIPHYKTDIESLRREVTAWKAASGHPNILPIIEAFTDKARFIVVSEYAPDGSLGDMLLNRIPTDCDVKFAVDTTLKILSGLTHLHSRNIVHRDMKPDNILLQGITPRLADFGLARIADVTHQTNRIAGSFHYMSPEAFEGSISAKCDLWAIAVILYQLLTGRLPFPQKTYSELLTAIYAKGPEALPNFVPISIQNVIFRALKTDIQSRFSSAEEMHNALSLTLRDLGSTPDRSFIRTAEHYDDGEPTLRRFQNPLEYAENDSIELSVEYQMLRRSHDIVGIDIGTQNLRVAILRDGKTFCLPNIKGETASNSTLAYSESEGWLIGSVAKKRLLTDPHNTIASINRLIGSQYRDAIDRCIVEPTMIVSGEAGDTRIALQSAGKIFAPEKLMAQILGMVVENVGIAYGRQFDKIVVNSHGVGNNRFDEYFSYAFRLDVACQLAGLKVYRTVPNTAAAALWLFRSEKRTKSVAVLDFGAGKFEVSVIEVGSGVIEVLSTTGDRYLGGNEIDERLVNWMISEFVRMYDIDLSEDNVAKQRLREAAERAKIDLSTVAETEINLPFITTDRADLRHLIMKIKRAKLEELAEPVFNRLLAQIDETLKQASVRTRDVEEIVLVGGSMRIPKVQKIIGTFFGKEPNKAVNSGDVVSLGIAVQGGILGGKKTDLLLLDILPVSLGIEATNNVMTPMILNNTNIPTRKSSVFTTSSDFQDKMVIHVLAGESPIASHNESLAKFTFLLLAPQPKGVPQIEVIIEVDSNRKIVVFARDLGTNKSRSVVISLKSISKAKTIPSDPDCLPVELPEEK